MLQQTQVKTVVPYYRRFLRRFPSLLSLARAREPEVLALWSGLGYYRRARMLHQAAKAVSERDGGFPRDPQGLRELPGIGAYTAAAVASMAFGHKAAVVDGNVIRVLCRLYGLRGDPAQEPLKGALVRKAGELLDPARPGDFNQAVMELGALICVPRGPECRACPLSRGCRATRLGQQDRLPELAQRRKTERTERTVVVLKRRGKLFVAPKVKGKGHGTMEGMVGFPEHQALDPLSLEKIYHASNARLVAEFDHSITHYRIHVRAYLLGSPALKVPGPGRWVAPRAAQDLPLAAADRRILRVLIDKKDATVTKVPAPKIRNTNF